jgi:hypothetical protein
MPGHIFVAAFPGEHRLYVLVVGVIGCVILLRHLLRRPPRTAAQVAALTGWVMLIAILLAPATRVGYLLYPINLLVWAWMLRQAEEPASPTGAVAQAAPVGSVPVVARPGAESD